MSEPGTSESSSRLNSYDGNVEGSQVQESGPLKVINEYKKFYNECMEKIEECCDNEMKQYIKPLKKMLEDLWEQNGLLLKIIEDLEETSNRQMQKMHRRHQQELAMASVGTKKMEKHNTTDDSGENKGSFGLERLEGEKECESSANPVVDSKQMKTVAVQVASTDKCRCRTEQWSEETEKSRLEVLRLEEELVRQQKELAAAQDAVKNMDANFKETRWALAAEVAEKHDQVLELRRVVGTLEETLRQADMQTHFKDDIIKKMRLELKNAKTTRSEGRKLCDVVAEVTQQQRRLEERMAPGVMQRRQERGQGEGDRESGGERAEGEGPTPRERVALLRECLKADIHQLELEEDRLKNGNGAETKCQTALGAGDGGETDSASSTSSSKHDCSIVRSKAQFAAATLRDIQANVDGLITLMKQNVKISEKGDGGDYDGRLKTLEGEFRDVECHLLDIAGTLNDSSPFQDGCGCHRDRVKVLHTQLQERDETVKSLRNELTLLKQHHKTESEEQGVAIEAVGDLVALVDEILLKMAVNVDSTGNGSQAPTPETLKHRIRLLNEALFNVCLPGLREELAAERKLVSNKEETLQNLHTMVELREKQVETFTTKVQDLERQLDEQRQVIADLQEAVQKCKQLEIRSRDKEICSLRFEVCELELKQRMSDKELRKKEEELQLAQDFNLSLRKKLSFVTEELLMLQPQLRDSRRRSAQCEKICADLKMDLQQRDAEVLALQKQTRTEWQKKVKSLEKSALKTEEVVCRLSEMVDVSKRAEKDARAKLKESQAQIKKLEDENTKLQRDVIKRHQELQAYEQHEVSELNDLEATVRNLHGEMINMQKRCSVLTADLDRQKAIRRELESEIDKHQRVIIKLEETCNEWARRCDEAQAKEMQVREAMHCLKEEGMQRLMQESSAKISAEEEVVAARAEISKLQKLQSDYEELRVAHSKVLERVKMGERVKGNLEKLLSQAEEERRHVEEERASLEAELLEVKEDNALLQDKVANLARSKERESQNHAAENSRTHDRIQRMSGKIEIANEKIRDYEGRVIPDLRTALNKQDRIIDALKAEVREADSSCMRMRQEALALIQSTELHFSSHKMAATGDTRRGEDHRSAVAAMSDSVFADMQRRRPSGGCDPWSPAPPAAHSVWSRHHTRLHDSSERVESGFQSMMQSPVNTMADLCGCGPDQDCQDLSMPVS